MSEGLLRVLRKQADLIRQWHRYELGMKPPEPLNYAALAALLEEAAQRIEQLERDR